MVEEVEDKKDKNTKNKYDHYEEPADLNVESKNDIKDKLLSNASG